jgi:RimJ/RimL family protein N-acetyltransferase
MPTVVTTDRMRRRPVTVADAGHLAKLDVLRVIAWTMTVNTRSRRVMEKAGLTFVHAFVEG